MKRQISIILAISLFFQSLVSFAQPSSSDPTAAFAAKLQQQLQSTAEREPSDSDLRKMFDPNLTPEEAVPLDETGLPAGSALSVRPAQQTPAVEVAKPSSSRRFGFGRDGYVGRWIRRLVSGRVSDYVSQVGRQIRVPNETAIDYVDVSTSPLPFVELRDPGELEISVGMFGATRNEDELAAAIASALAEQNDEDVNRVRSDVRIKQMLSTIRGYDTLNRETQSYILKDLSVIDRLIRAGYNPWAYYYLTQRTGAWHNRTKGDRRFFQWIVGRFNRRERAHIQEKPSDEIRGSAIKNYLVYLQKRLDIADQIKTYQPFPADVQKKHRRISRYLEPFRNIWVQRGLVAAVGGLLAKNDVVGWVEAALTPLAWLGTGAVSVLKAMAAAAIFVLEPIGRLAGAMLNGVMSGIGWVFDTIIIPVGSAVISGLISGVSSVWHAATWVLWVLTYPLVWAYNTLVPFNILGWIESLLEAVWEIMPSGETVLSGTFIAAGLAAIGAIVHLFDRHFIHTHLAKSDLEDIEFHRKLLPPADRIGDQLDDEEISQIWRSAVSILEKIDAVIEVYPLVYDFRMWNGLTTARKEAVEILSLLIDVTASRFNKLDPDDRERLSRANDLWNIISGYVDRIPGFVFEIPQMESQLGVLRTAVQKLQARSPLTRWEAESLARIQGEYLFETRLRLLERLTTGLPTDPGEMIDYILALHSHDLEQTALSLYSGRDRELSRYAVSAKNKVAERRDGLRRFRGIYSLQRTVTSPGRLGRMRRSFETFLNDIKLSQGDLKNRLALMADNMNVESVFNTIMNLGLDNFDHWQFRRLLARNTSSVQELTAFVNNEILPALGEDRVDRFASDFEKVIQARFDVIRTREDINTLLETSYFWPRSYGWKEHMGGSLDYLFTDTLNELIKQFPNVWSYEPASTARYHRLILARMEELRIFPNNVDEQIELWSLLTTRGVSGDSDRLFYTIYSRANSEQKAHLERVGLIEGRVWEQDIKALIAENKVWASSDFQDLLVTVDPAERSRHIENILSLVQSYMPEGGWPYMQLLEKISVAIRSTEPESARIHSAKSVTRRTRSTSEIRVLPSNGEDSRSSSSSSSVSISLGTMAEIMDQILKWSRRHQWEFVLFLRGDIRPTARIRRAFRMLGPDRVKRMYDVLPLGTRAALLESFLSSSRGLIPTIGSRGYTSTIIDHLMSGASPAAAEVSRNILESFMYAIKDVGNEPLQSYILSYLLAIPPSEQKNAALVLKQVLEVFGSTGVKIGQFLAASELLSPEESLILSELQDRALMPERETIFGDLRQIFGVETVPFILGDLLGAASIKYASEATPIGGDDAPVVLKVFREEALAHTRLEFMILESMVEYLISKYGKKYAVLRGIINASKNAVKRELVAKDEVGRTEVFRTRLYNDTSSAGIRFTAPMETFVNDRLIISQLMKGVSFKDLPEDLKPTAAAIILQKHDDVMWNDSFSGGDGRSAEFFEMDPDRHGGNFRFQLADEKTGQFAAIDAGQLHTRIPVQWRDQLIELVAISGIVAHAGVNEWASQQIANVLGLDSQQRDRLRKTLSLYYPDRSLREGASYYSLLGAIFDAGIEVPDFFYDFMKGIVTFRPYQKYVDSSAASPVTTLITRVHAAVERLKPTATATNMESGVFVHTEAKGLWDKMRDRGAELIRNNPLRPSTPAMRRTGLGSEPDVLFSESYERPDFTELDADQPTEPCERSLVSGTRH